ncbi:hypothetical protein FA15DRAFT_658499 [Coprinopsis marcescibilis]|uniref:Uncharacterized protein n=1 Tax=Coprinopsis marcescibilis TaxID=230819 RepID=A0A5C3KLS8_COPMA|nr:hypothetical protein FA15DRAFT_658499 [Coprinopsis marcescibilis]
MNPLFRLFVMGHSAMLVVPVAPSPPARTQWQWQRQCRCPQTGLAGGRQVGPRTGFKVKVTDVPRLFKRSDVQNKGERHIPPVRANTKHKASAQQNRALAAALNVLKRVFGVVRVRSIAPRYPSSNGVVADHRGVPIVKCLSWTLGSP